jgi:tetratricopeptide (TPR) repeat protein
MVFGSTLTCITAALISGVCLTGQTPPVSASFRTVASTTTAMPQPSGPVGVVVSEETRGDIFMARKMYREAIEVYKEGPSDSAVLLNKTGIAYHQMLDLNDAKKYYQRAVKLDPRYAEAINNLGTIEYSRKNYRRAVSLYKKALRLSPNAASIYSNLGTGYFARKDYKEATEAFRKALALDPEVFEHKSTHGVLLQERTVEERAKYHYYLAKMYAQAGTNDRALMYIRKALEEGFKDKKKFQEDPEFSRMRDLPEFKELLAMDHRVL